MALRDIIRTVAGRVFGMDVDGQPVFNKQDGSQIVIQSDAAGVPTVETTTAEGVTTEYSMAGVDGAEIITGVVGDGATLNDAAIEAATDNLVSIDGVRARIKTAGNYRIAGFDHHPSLSLPMDSRGAVRFQADDNLPATNDDGAEHSLIRVLARTHPDAGVFSYTSVLSGFNIDGRKGSQVNPVIGIRMPNPNPAENTFDPDPGFTTNKDYAAARLMNVEISGTSGSGVVVEAGRGRFFAQDVRAINCGGVGLHVKANDTVIGDRCGFGGNAGHALIIGGGSGGLIHDVNMWGCGLSNTRSASALAFKSADTKSGTMRGCQINDTAWFHGDSSYWRGWYVGGNLCSPHDENFESDGVAIDAAADPKTQCHIAVDGYQNLHIGANIYSRSTAVDFATPGNVGGNLDGSSGTAYDYILDISGDAEVTTFLPYSSRPNVKPWNNVDPVPINTRTDGQATYITQDSYTGVTRVGARGSLIDSHVMLAVDETAAPDLNYAVQIGDTARRNIIEGRTEFSAAPLMTLTAVDARPTSNGGSRNISDKLAVQELFTSGTIATFTVNLPYIHYGSKELTVSFTGGKITALTWQTYGSDDVTLSAVPSAQTNDNTEAYFPTTIDGLTTVRLYWSEESTEWYITDIYQRGDPWVALVDGANIATDADAGNSFSVTLAGNRTLDNPSNLTDGQALGWKITQDATGGRTLAYGNKFTFLDVTETPRLSRTANAVDLLIGIYDAATDKIYCQLVKAQAAAWVQLTDGATIDTDCALGSNFYVTLGGNRTLQNPTRMTDGQRFKWRITQDGTGNRTLAYGGKFRFPGGTAATVLSVGAGAVDVISGIYDATADLVYCELDKAYAA